MPAESAYVAVLRMATAGIAARLDFTLDDVEDLRMAVSEACAMVLAEASGNGSMSAAFFLSENRVEVHISADADHPVGPDREGFAWQVLETMASDVEFEVVAERVTIRLAVSTSAASRLS